MSVYNKQDIRRETDDHLYQGTSWFEINAEDLKVDLEKVDLKHSNLELVRISKTEATQIGQRIVANCDLCRSRYLP